MERNCGKEKNSKVHDEDKKDEPDGAEQNPGAEQEKDAWWHWQHGQEDSQKDFDREEWKWQRRVEDWEDWESYVKLYIENLPADITPAYIQNVFEAFGFGHIEDIHVMQGRHWQTRKSCAMVVFASHTEAEKCRYYFKWNDYEFKKGHGPVNVRYARDQQLLSGKGKGNGKGKGTGRRGPKVSGPPCMPLMTESGNWAMAQLQ